MECPCPLIYIGETTTKCRLHINNHKSTIRTGKVELPVPRHFLEQGHTVMDLTFSIIDHVPSLRRGGNREKILKQREVWWINKLRTLYPLGLNLDYPFQVFL